MINIKKAWWQSSTVWAGVIITGIDVANYFAEPAHTVLNSVSSVAIAVGAILTIIFRVWFTHEPITDHAQQKLVEKLATK